MQRLCPLVLTHAHAEVPTYAPVLVSIECFNILLTVQSSLSAQSKKPDQITGKEEKLKY